MANGTKVLTQTNTGTASPAASWADPGGGGAGSIVFPFGLALGGDAAVEADLALWPTCQAAGTWDRVDVSAKTGPIGADLIIDILLSSNHGATFVSLWASTPSNRPTILDGAASGFTTSFDTPGFSVGDILRIDIKQVGSGIPGKNISVRLKGSYT